MPFISNQNSADNRKKKSMKQKGFRSNNRVENKETFGCVPDCVEEVDKRIVKGN